MNSQVKAKEGLSLGQVLDIEVKKIGINGEGIAYFQKHVIFIPGALPTELVKVKIIKIEKTIVQAKLLQIIKEAKERITPKCPVYNECGGCSLQHLQYEAQLKAKEELVKEALEKYAKIKQMIKPIIGMDNPWGYRNKAQLPVKEVDGKVKAGLYKQGSHKLVEIGACPIQHPKTNEVIEVVRGILAELKIPIYDERKRTGVIRHIVARVGFATEETQLTLITATDTIPKVKELVQEIKKRLPYIDSIVQNINQKKTSLVFGEKTIVLQGKERIEERLGDITYYLSPRAFFQLNPEQTVKLYNEVERAANLTGKEIVVDAYCGVGTIGLWLAKKAKKVIGIDIIREAIEDAKRNAMVGNYQNVEYVVGKVEELLPKWYKKGFQADVVIVDPPRTGLDIKLRETLLKIKPKKIVYVSCNPSTLGKDLALFLQNNYKVESIQPVDMFPQTMNVECVVLMSRIEK